jgi:hypothetical protein
MNATVDRPDCSMPVKAARALMGSARVAAALVVGLLTAVPARGQQMQTPSGLHAPRLFVVSPAGARAGESVEVTVSGYDLEDSEGLLFSNPTITAKPLGTATPPAASDDRNRQGQRDRMALGPLTSYRFQVTVPREVAPSVLDVRVVNKWGVSSPRAFVIGDLAEAVEHEPNDDVGQAERVALESTVSGTISGATDIDDFVFTGTKNQHVIISGLASSIDSRLLMAVELYDASGKRLAANHEYLGTDTLCDVELAADGDYLVRVFAFTYSQGGPEHFYRLSITTAPWIDAVFPPWVEPGRTAAVTVYGRNLPGGLPDPSATLDGRVLERITTTVTAPDAPQFLSYGGLLAPKSSWLDGFEFRLRNASGVSNPVMIGLAKAPVVLDQGGNDTPATAQAVPLPCAIAGRIEARRDRDWYTFDAKKGEVYTIEAVGDQLGAELDLYFNLRKLGSEKPLLEDDDSAEVMDPVQFFIQTRDPARIRFVVPEDARYALLVSSHEAAIQAGPRDQYTIRIMPQRPDFRLVVMSSSPGTPDACNILRGGRIDQSVYLWRLDGFEGPVALSAEGLPEGMTCLPQVVGTGQKQGTLVLSAAPDMEPWTGTITIKGTATVDGQTVVREARAATILYPIPPQQRNLPARARLARSEVAAVRGQAPFALAAGVAEATARPGDKLTIPVMLTRLDPNFKAPVQLNVNAAALPPGMTFAPTSLAGNRTEEKTVVSIGQNAKPGVYSIVVLGQGVVSVSRAGQGNKTTSVNASFPATPVSLTVLPKAR